MLAQINTILYRASPENPSTSLARPAKWLMDLFAPPSKSGVRVNTKSTIGLTAVWRAVMLLSESIASIPFDIIEEEGDITRRATDHPLYKMVNMQPAEMYSSFDFRMAFMFEALMEGEVFVLPVRKGANAVYPEELLIMPKTEFGIRRLHPNKPSKQVFYKVEALDAILGEKELIHVKWMTPNGVDGLNTIGIHRDNFGFGLATRDFGNQFYKNGAHLGGWVKYPGKLTPEQINNIKRSIQTNYSGIENVGRVGVFEEGMEYNETTVDFEKLQMLNAQRFNVEEVSRIFGVSPHLLSSLERATFNNIEQLSQEFATYTIRPWIKRIEQEFNRKIFPQDEQGRFKVRLNMNAFLRGDTDSRAEFYKKLIESGVMSVNEARRAEKLNPIDGGNIHLVPLNMGTLENINDRELSQIQNNNPTPNESAEG